MVKPLTTKHYYFYVLKCRDNTLYAGFTTDLQKRVATHNASKGAKYTQLAKRRPVVPIYAELWRNKSLAMSAEAKFKRLTRAQKEHYLRIKGVPSIVTITQDMSCHIEDMRHKDTTLNHFSIES